MQTLFQTLHLPNKSNAIPDQVVLRYGASHPFLGEVDKLGLAIFLASDQFRDRHMFHGLSLGDEKSKCEKAISLSQAKHQ